MSARREDLIYDDVSNPLDNIEEVLDGYEWAFNRPHDDELSVQVAGDAGHYTMTFFWQEEYCAMQLFCEYDLHIPKERQALAANTLKNVNESLWLGHFSIPADSAVPCFRHTCLFRGMVHTSGTDHISDLVNIALLECDRHYNTFNMLASSLYLDDDLLKLTMMESAGEA